MITKPKGTYDLLNEDALIYSYVNNVFENVMNLYNFDYIRTPLFEASELYHRCVGEGTDIVTKETYDFKDRGARNITLRPEGTAGVVRSFIENKLYGNRNDAIKLYYNGTMYRYERPQAGRYREFVQFGAEVFGSNEVMADAELISMGYNFLNLLGIENVVVKLNTLGDTKTRGYYTAALVKYFEPHINELCSDCKTRIKTNPLRILDCKVDGESNILKNAPKISDYLSNESKERFNELKEILNLLEVDYEVDETIVRGLDYYTEFVFEYKLEDGLALGAGGRYNSLVKNLGGPDIPAVGLAFGIERLILELKNNINMDSFNKKIDVYIMSVSEEEKLHAMNISQNLRLNGIKTEINSNNLSLKSQFKVADSLNASFIIILNNEDLQKGLVNIKDNATKEEIKIDENNVADWLLGNL